MPTDPRRQRLPLAVFTVAATLAVVTGSPTFVALAALLAIPAAVAVFVSRERVEVTRD